MSNSPAIVSPMTSLRASSQKGMTQPPWVKPFLGSSLGPPGDCMTPSTVTWVRAMSLLIVFSTTPSWTAGGGGLGSAAGFDGLGAGLAHGADVGLIRGCGDGGEGGVFHGVGGGAAAAVDQHADADHDAARFFDALDDLAGRAAG